MSRGQSPAVRGGAGRVWGRFGGFRPCVPVRLFTGRLPGERFRSVAVPGVGVSPGQTLNERFANAANVLRTLRLFLEEAYLHGGGLGTGSVVFWLLFLGVVGSGSCWTGFLWVGCLRCGLARGGGCCWSCLVGCERVVVSPPDRPVTESCLLGGDAFRAVG